MGHEQGDRAESRHRRTKKRVAWTIRRGGEGEERDRHDDRSRGGVKRIAQFQRNVPTRPRSRSIAICRGKDGTRYVTVLSPDTGATAEEIERCPRVLRDLQSLSSLAKMWIGGKIDTESVYGGCENEKTWKRGLAE